MIKVIVFCLVAGIAVVNGNSCHVTNDETSTHCGDVKNMTCVSNQFTPFCHKIRDSTAQMNGICTCEKFCYDVKECTEGCYHSHAVCQEAYTNSLEKICKCVRN